MATECQGKSSWPELLGVSGTTAVATIERENPLVTAIIVLPGTFITPDFRCDRVWVYVDSNNNVNEVPRIG
ncbi:Glu protease inhibitor [Olea europaea subsp. europaea]|uniref:Glu protease inhibitor n=1 Tax=Olea europaea subsp. europaea TaxID=158383 RepID=A0A8S0T4T0_OLEEU|nr:Glu protease inhibitor [Olea europaea subsp. europaea]